MFGPITVALLANILPIYDSVPLPPSIDEGNITVPNAVTVHPINVHPLRFATLLNATVDPPEPPPVMTQLKNIIAVPLEPEVVATTFVPGAVNEQLLN